MMPSSSDLRRSAPVPESIQRSGLWVFESRHDNSFFMLPTQHRFPKLLYFREGRGEIAADWTANKPETTTCISGDCFIVPAHLPHRIIDDPAHPISLYGLAVDPSRVSSFNELEALIPAGKLSRQRVSQLGIEGRLRRLLYLASQESPAYHLSAVAGAIETFAQIAMASLQRVLPPSTVRNSNETAENSSSAIDEYLRWLDSNFFEPLSVDRAAMTCHMSRRKFTTDFRLRTGKTWLAYVNQLRVEHATSLLRNSDSKVASIAFQSGFEDLSTFYRTIRRLTGKRPLEHRADNAE